MLRDRAKQRLRERIEERLAPPEIESTPVERDPEFDAKAEEAIPASVRMISGCHDTQTSADVQNVSTFQLPDAAGKAGGALTSSMLNIIYQEEEPSAQDLSFVDVFLKARDLIKEKGFTQTPQLSSSRNIDVSQPFDLMTNEFGSEGTRYAVLIGINYVNHTRGRLSGCHNDVYNIKKYIMDVGKFEEENIVCLLDDGVEREPSKDGIMEALEDLVNKVKSVGIVLDITSIFAYHQHVDLNSCCSVNQVTQHLSTIQDMEDVSEMKQAKTHPVITQRYAL